MWLLTNKLFHRLKKYNNSSSFHFYSDQEFYNNPEKDLIIYYDGYVLPRLGVASNETKYELIREQYLQHGAEFIHQVKGNFTIIIIDGEDFFIFSDRFAIKKYFQWQSGQDFILSNDLNRIVSKSHSKPSKENIAIYALTYHFIGGCTIFDDISHNIPGEYLVYTQSLLRKKSYWVAKQLIQLEKMNISTQKIGQILEQIIESYLKFTNTTRVSHALTSGIDSRLLYSILKTKAIDLHTYTYGNPNSIDSVIAKLLSEEFKVKHDNHSLEFSSTAFAKIASESVNLGQSLCSLHRAHRYKAIFAEANYGDLMFLGTMGGEFIKSTSRDDYIIPNFIFDYSVNKSAATLTYYLKQKKINHNQLNIDYLQDFFQNQEWCNDSEFAEFYGLTEIAASLHHGQNDQLYSDYFEQVFTPYIDIDYLEAIFTSEFNFLVKKKFRSKFRQRLENHRFGSEIQRNLEPAILNVPYNSGFVASEYLKSPIIAAIKSRIRKRNWNYPASFPLDGFMKDYVIRYLTQLERTTGIINDVFDIPGLLQELNKTKLNTSEAFWLKFTNPIQMDLILKKFFREN